MAHERHLVLQEVTLRPSGEWNSPEAGWTVVRVADGMGYWLQSGGARELKVGDGFVVAQTSHLLLRASQLGSLKLEYYCVHPQFLNGLITVTEGHQLEQVGKNSAAPVIAFNAADLIGKKLSHLVAQSQRETLTVRSALLQLWSQAISPVLQMPASDQLSLRLQDRFQRFFATLSDTELATRSLRELAGQLNCSERHLSRLFRAEFGVPLRQRQTELRLQRASQLLLDANAKIISVALESGYRHLGLFNAMFKRRFGMTPSAWRQQKNPSTKNCFKRAAALLLLLPLLQTLLAPVALAQATNAVAANAAANAGPKFAVEKYLVSGNTVLPPEKIGAALTNAPGAFGTNVTFADIRSALGSLQMAYRERGFVTVSVALPPQKLTNATVKVKVTEGRLAAINVKNNNYFSTENVLRSLPSLHTNMLLNSHVFQRELDLANANRDRQIYPVISPGLEPGTSDLTLKVKDRFPLHSRVEINNQATPGTPDSRINFNAQYGNLWQLEHQVGISYGFTPLNFHPIGDYYFSPLDSPLIANYSAYYRLPLGRANSVQQQIDESRGHFGYDEVTHKFNLPPSSGRPELSFYASRSVSDTGVQKGPKGFANQPGTMTNNGVAFTPLSITTNSAGQNVTLNESLGLRLSMPLPQWGRLSSAFSVGADFKRYQAASYNTNENNFAIQYVDNNHLVTILDSVPAKFPIHRSALDYFPVNFGLNGSLPDQWGLTIFNAQANFNLATIGHIGNLTRQSGTNITVTPGVSYAPDAADHYVTLQMGANREQRLYKDWTMLLRADGQWANTPLFSNEQFGMGGVSGVRGYSDGEAYGDTGWRVAIEPRTPLINLGMVDGDLPFWVRASVFMDYGEIYLLHKASAASKDAMQFWGIGTSLTANIGSHLDARLTLALPLLATATTPAWDFHFYFGVGCQF
ncbi:MAG: helix-turn-helix domain-containing protein [Verrucomicrobiota bacterium]